MAQILQELGQSVMGGVAFLVAAAFLVEGFLGYKLFRVWIAITGFGVGFLIGVFVFEQQSFWVGGSIVIGLGCALLAFFFYRVGVFFQCGVMVGLLTILLMGPEAMIVGAVFGILAGIAAVMFVRPFVILTTGIPGGLVGGALLPAAFGLVNGGIMVFMGLCMAVACCVVQFRTTEDGRTLIMPPEENKGGTV